MKNYPFSLLITLFNRGLPGGPQGHLPYLSSGLRETGVEVYEVLYGRRFKDEGFFKRTLNTFWTIWTIVSKIIIHNIDIIQINSALDTNGLIRDFLTVLVLKVTRIHIFIKFHGSDERLLNTDNGVLRSMYKILFRSVDLIGVLSSAEKENFIKCGVDRSKVRVVKNILRESDYLNRVAPASIKQKTKDAKIIIFSARFIPEKGLFETLQACRILKEKGFEFLLICLGDGPIRYEAESLTAELKLSNNVTFTGQIPEEEARNYYASADVLVLPTYHYEGFPMSIFQSVASGLPIITTRIRGAADYLKEPDNCLWVQENNPTQLAEKIGYLFSNPLLASQMSKNNSQLARQFFPEQVVPEYIEIYKELMS